MTWRRRSCDMTSLIFVCINFRPASSVGSLDRWIPRHKSIHYHAKSNPVSSCLVSNQILSSFLLEEHGGDHIKDHMTCLVLESIEVEIRLVCYMVTSKSNRQITSGLQWHFLWFSFQGQRKYWLTNKFRFLTLKVCPDWKKDFFINDRF